MNAPAPNYTEFSDSRLVTLYEPLNPFGRDTEFFCAQAAKLAAQSIIDLGCGTGLLTCELARRGHRVTGIEPSPAMLAVARAKPNAEQIQWIQGSFEKLGGLRADLLLMTSHVAQFFLEEKDWRAMLLAAHGALVKGGYLVFDVRRLSDPPFADWPTEKTRRKFTQTPLGSVEWWFQLVSVKEKRVRYELHYLFGQSGEKLVSLNELIFRSREEIVQALLETGFSVEAIYGDWDSSPLGEGSPEMIFIAKRR